jgi:hypothetical protein
MGSIKMAMICRSMTEKIYTNAKSAKLRCVRQVTAGGWGMFMLACSSIRPRSAIVFLD